MAPYRDDRMPGGSRYILDTSWEEEAAGAIVGGASSAAGWLIGSGISGLRTLARNSQDRRVVRAATALEEASESEDDDRFLELAMDFTRRYPRLEDGHAALAQALQRKGQFDAAIDSIDRAVQLGLDEMQAHMLRADIYDDADKPGNAIQEFTILTQSQIPELRQLSLLGRARILMQIGDLDQALKDANDAIGTLPDESAYTLRGHVYRSKNDLASCLQDYSRAVQLCPGSPDFLENQAQVFEMMGRDSDARADRTAVSALRAEKSPEPPSTDPPQARSGTESDATAATIDTGQVKGEGVGKYGPWAVMGFGILIFLLSVGAGSGGGGAFAFAVILAGGIWKVLRIGPIE